MKMNPCACQGTASSPVQKMPENPVSVEIFYLEEKVRHVERVADELRDKLFGPVPTPPCENIKGVSEPENPPTLAVILHRLNFRLQEALTLLWDISGRLA